MSERQISDGSANQNKVEFLAEGALNQIIGDLKQEIAAGSYATTGMAGGATFTYYRPGFPAGAVPAFSGTAGLSGTVAPNLLKRSARGESFFPSSSKYNFPNNTVVGSSTTSVTYPPSNRAAALSSTTASLNQRRITLSRWNAPLLLPKQNPASNSDLTPNPANFTAPDWVLIERSGSTPALTSYSSALAWSATNSTTIVGRYAYVIYDEGGLLDLNVAGHPAAAANLPEIFRKGVPPFADLTQLATDTSSTLTATEADKIIAWRNAFSAGTATGYVSAMLSNTTGFLIILGSNTVTDRAFVSRQALIKFMISGTLSLPGAQTHQLLQQLGTFSRDLNQPSFIPDPNRPRIKSPGSMSGSSWNTSTYQGGNDGYPGDDTINPAFPSVIALASGTRNDGTPINRGDLLVKKRFDLRRLAWLTYNGPSRGRSGVDIQQVLDSGSSQAINAAFLAQGTPEAIYNYFGLTYTGGLWVYGHGAPGGRIGTLQDVQSMNPAREPDFFELLKASINAGSLGKSAGSGDTGMADGGFYQHQLDLSLDRHILQIGANIMDQSDADGYPTIIQFGNIEVRGVENLPGVYSVSPTWAYKTAPVPLITGSYQMVLGSSALINPGEALYFHIPTVWNMHDQNDLNVRGANYALGNPRPGNGQIRVVAKTNDPLDKFQPWLIGVRAQASYPNASGVMTGLNKDSAPAIALSSTNAALTFGDNGGLLFREPTKLWKRSLPPGSGLSTSGSSAVDLYDGTAHVGFYLGSTPLESVSPGVVTSTGTSFYIAKVVNFYTRYSAPVGSQIGLYGAMTLQCQFQDASNVWRTYCDKYWDHFGLVNPDIDLGSSNPFTNGQAIGALPNRAGIQGIGADPRTPRWYFGHGEAAPDTSLDYPGSPTVTPNPNFCVVPTMRPATSTFSITHWGPGSPGSVTPTAFTPNVMFYEGPSYTYGGGNAGNWGMFTQNNPYVIINTNKRQFNADADGVVRRAMGAYVSVNSSGVTTSPLGLALATATNYSSGVGTPNASQSQSRPIILNRPFKGVEELGYVFKGIPYKNLDFFTPESGDAALLDVFCVGDNSRPDGLVAGKVSLNTRQPAVLQSLLSRGFTDELALSGSVLTPTESRNIANALIARTTGTASWQGPLSNLSELVGRYVGKNINAYPSSAPVGYFVSKLGVPGTDWSGLTETVTYSGFSADLNTAFSATQSPIIQRLRQAALRPLANCGQTRVWNLMIDLIAQTGRYPKTASTSSNPLAAFLVEGEKRYWLHIAIDRVTGKVLDAQLECVSE